MPLQSGSDRVLKAMNRNYRMKRYLEIANGLKAAAPDVAITTDFIVGFPSETEAEFEESLDAIRQVGFVASYSFMFSPRPGTEAAMLVDDVSDTEKLRRLQKLQALQGELTTQALQAWVGKTTEVLIDGPSAFGEGKLQGRNSQGFVVNILDNDQSALQPGDLVNVVIQAPSKFTLKGYLEEKQGKGVIPPPRVPHPISTLA
jgi:tRNA-2-methylthio-N6-dimethylallyladenosine synthase